MKRWQSDACGARLCQSSRRAGATMVVVTGALVVLLGCAALTVDVGHVAMVGSRAQGLADACALAAAAGPVVGHQAEVCERAGQMLAANQQEVWPASLNDQAFAYYGNGQSVPDYGALGPRDEAVRVAVRIPTRCTFANVFGISERLVERRAVALRSGSAGDDAMIFAMNSNPGDWGIKFSGSYGVNDGTVHSNTRIEISGSNHTFTGPVEWVNELKIGGSTLNFNGGRILSTVQPPPISYAPDDFAPFTYIIHGDYIVSQQYYRVPAGCYRVYGKVEISASNVNLQNVTFVADDNISLSGSQLVYSPNRLGVFAYSLSSAPSDAIRLSGASMTGSGTLYAPVGGVTISGSGSLTSNMVGWFVELSGSNYTLRPSPDSGGGKYSIRLIG